MALQVKNSDGSLSTITTQQQTSVRDGLGLGSAALANDTDFASAAQGVKADSALQEVTVNAISDATVVGKQLLLAQSNVDAHTVLGLGSAALADSSVFATAAQGAKADQAVFQINGQTPDPNGNISISITGNANWATLTGNPIDNSDLVNYINSLISPANHAPVATQVDSNVSDTATTLSVNLLQNATDADSDTIVLSSYSYNQVSHLAGTQITTTYGTILIASSGAVTFTLGSAARALALGQQAVETFSFTISDGKGGSDTKPFTITIAGTNNAPILIADTGSVANGGSVSGNVLLNDTDAENDTLTVVSYSVNSTTYTAGDSASIANAGTLTIASNGGWQFNQSGSYIGEIIATYTATDGTNTVNNGSLTINVLPAEPTVSDKLVWLDSYSTITPNQSRIAPNPLTRVTQPDQSTVYSTYTPWDYTVVLPNQTGDLTDSLDFRVGDGMEYTSLNDIPWRKLLPGDNIFIYHRATPYAEPIQLQWARGDQNRWIQIIGVPDANGNRPVLTGENLVFPSNFTTQTEYYGGLISIGPNATATAGWKPGYIHIYGLEVRDVRSWNNRTLADGTTGPWDKFDSGIYGRGLNYFTVSGCKFENCGQASFIFSVPSTPQYRFASQNIHYLFNYFNINGNPDLEDHEHTIYHEGIASCYEYNWFDVRYPNSTGYQMKERSAGIIYRYNVMEGGDHSMITFQDPDSDPDDLTPATDAYGTNMVNQAYLYGNLFLLRDSPDNFPAGPITWGAGAGSTNIRSGDIYFYNNVTLGNFSTYQLYAPQPPSGAGDVQDTSCPMFNLINASPTVVHAYNNMAYNYGVGSYGLFALQGWADFKTNVFSSFVLHTFNYVWGTDVVGTAFDGTGLNGLTASTFDPKIRAYALGDYYIEADSPYNGLSEAPHADVILRGLQCDSIYPNAPYGKAKTPVVSVNPTLTNAVGGFVYAGTTLSVVAGTYAFGATSYTYEFKINGATVGMSTSYTPQASDIGQTLTFIEHASNSAGTTDTTISFTIIAADQPANSTPPTIVGTPMVNNAIVVNNGVWTNSPVSYTIDILLNGVSVGASYTPVVADIGKTVTASITATGSGGSSSTVVTAGKVVVAEAFTPDAQGVWDFYRVTANTTLETIGGWQGSTPNYYATSLGLVGDSDYLRGCWYTGNGSPNSQSVGAIFSPMTYDSYPYLWMQSTTDQDSGYQVQIIGSVPRLDIYLNATLVQSTSNIAQLANIATQETKMVCTLTNNGDGTAFLEVFINDVSVYTHTFSGSDVLTGGYPGFRAPGTGMPMKKWTYNPSASSF
jgi:VCBS repeat-containing protein